VFDLAKATLRSNRQTPFNISSFSYAPSSNEADWALRAVTPHMLMSNNYFPRAIDTINNYSLM
jgi:hypothetical protein